MYSSADGHFDCFYFLAIINSATMNIRVQVFMWMYVSISLGCIPRSSISESYGNSMVSFLRNCWTVSKSSCTVLHSHQQHIRVPTSAPPCWHLSLNILFSTATLVGVKTRCGFDSWFRKMPWIRKWQTTPVFLPGKSHGQRSLVGYSPWICRVYTTEHWAEHSMLKTSHACPHLILTKVLHGKYCIILYVR